MERVRRFAKNALIMSLTSVLMRTVGLIFNAYIAGRIGAEGMGLFSLISSVYVFGVTLASAGIQLSVNRLVSERLAEGDAGGARRAVRCAVCYALLSGFSAQIVLYFSAPWIGEALLSDMRTVLSLRALSWSLPFIALSNVLSGYFYAVRRVSRTALSSVLEQLTRIGVTVVLLFPLLPRGMEYGCLAVVVGMSVSEGASFFFLLAMYIAERKKCGKTAGEGTPAAKKLLSISVPVALSALLRSALVTTEHILIPRGLKKHGLDGASALSAYGVIHGMVFPVIFFPSAVTGAVAGLIVAEMSEEAADAHGFRSREIEYIVRRAYGVTLLYATAAAGVFTVFSDALGELIYSSADAAFYLRIFAAAVPVMYLDTVTDGMLKGLDQQIPSMIYNIIDAGVSVLLVLFLVPRLGIWGYVVTVFATEALNATLSVSRLLRVTGARIEILPTVIKPLLSAVGATTVSRIILPSPQSFLSLAVCILVFLAVYFCFAVMIGGITAEDMRWVGRVVGRRG